MTYHKLPVVFIFLTLLAFSCSTSKEALDKSTIKYSVRKENVIKELAEFSVAYTLHKPQKAFRPDSLADKTIKKKFINNGYSELITVTYKNIYNNKVFGLIDSTVIFKQTTLKGVTEIIYDFATDKRKFENDRTNEQQFVFLAVTNRIYYRRRPIPIM